MSSSQIKGLITDVSNEELEIVIERELIPTTLRLEIDGVQAGTPGWMAPANGYFNQRGGNHKVWQFWPTGDLDREGILAHAPEHLQGGDWTGDKWGALGRAQLRGEI